MEDKAAICKALLPVLQMTEFLADLADLQYERGEDGFEQVRAIFNNGAEKKVNVSCDSGVAMIRDITKRL